MSIKAENIKYVYSEGTPFRTLALDDVNATINQGEFVGIIGHTGSGKSTLIQLFNGLEPATEGKVEVDGTLVGEDKKKLKMIRQKVEQLGYYNYQLSFYRCGNLDTRY